MKPFDSIRRDEALSKLWEKRNEFEASDNLEEFEKLEAEIKAAPILTLHLAVEFTTSELEKIGERAREIFGNEIFIDFKVEASIIGGAIIIWKGVVKDFSVKQTMASKKAEFREILYGSGLR